MGNEQRLVDEQGQVAEEKRPVKELAKRKFAVHGVSVQVTRRIAGPPDVDDDVFELRADTGDDMRLIRTQAERLVEILQLALGWEAV